MKTAAKFYSGFRIPQQNASMVCTVQYIFADFLWIIFKSLQKAAAKFWSFDKNQSAKRAAKSYFAHIVANVPLCNKWERPIRGALTSQDLSSYTKFVQTQSSDTLPLRWRGGCLPVPRRWMSTFASRYLPLTWGRMPTSARREDVYLCQEGGCLLQSGGRMSTYAGRNKKSGWEDVYLCWEEECLLVPRGRTTIPGLEGREGGCLP